MGLFLWRGLQSLTLTRARIHSRSATIPGGGGRNPPLKRVYTAETLVQVVHVQNLLAASGIVAELRNARLAGALGEIPFLETWPQLWVDDPAFARANELIERNMRGAGETGEPWTCPGCGERIEGQFTECWRCGAGNQRAGA